MNNVNKPYSLEDIHQYLSGKMDAAAMHAIEKAALDDPLLAEAIEGYAAMPGFRGDQGMHEVQNALNTIRDRMHTRGKVRKINTSWRAAAAILLLLGGVAMAIYFTNNFNAKTPTVAATETVTQPPPMPANNSEVQTIKDSPVNVGELAKNNQSAKAETKVKAEPVPAPPPSQKKETTEEQNVASIAERDQTMPPVAMNETKPAENTTRNINEKIRRSAKAEQTNQQQLVLSGKVTDPNNNPIPYATIITENGLSSVTDKNGQYSMVIPGKDKKVSFRANNFRSQTIDANGGYKKVVLEPRRVQNDRNMNNAIGQAILLSNNGAIPKEGWPSYLHYLANKISYSEYDNGNPVIGETIVSFEIDALGIPRNFVFEKQIDEDVNDAIEEIIISGPVLKTLNQTTLPAKIKLKLIF